MIALTALGYWLMGRAGLLLAIPPGYATAIWPAAGVAFAALMMFGLRYWPGVFLGSFAINLGVGFDGSSMETMLRSVAMAGGIGLGAALQAAVGVLLVRRAVGPEPALDSPRDVILFMLLAGPVACLVNATVAQTALMVSGQITPTQMLFSGWVWWTGDVMGVMAMAPILMAFWAYPAAIWRPRRVTLVVPLLLVYGALVVGFYALSAKEQHRLQSAFERESELLLHRVQDSLGREFLIAESMAAHFAALGRADAATWQKMLALYAPHRAEAAALAWLQREPAGSDYALLNAPAANDLSQASADCAAVWRNLAQPSGLARYPALVEALELARDHGEGALSAPLQHPGGVEEPHCVAYVAPAYRATADTPEQRRLQIAGFALSIIPVTVRTHQMIPRSAAHVAVQVRDLVSDRVFATLDPLPRQRRFELQWERVVPVAQRLWDFRFAGSPTQGLSADNWQAWVALAGGVTLASLFGMFLLVVGGQTARVRLLVAQRTQALTVANGQLQQVVERNTALVEELRHTNDELGQFAYVASHDLREPLRTIESFVQLMDVSNPDKRAEEERTYLRYINEGVVRMQLLIEDLLQYSRIGRTPAPPQPVDLNRVLEDVQQSLQRSISESHAVIHADSLPVVRGDPVQWGQVFQNILSNSLKYRDERAPEIGIRVQRVGEEWEIRCSDNGIGFDPAQADKVFEPFKRLHEGGKYEGTGIGMAIVAKIIRQSGGSIRAEAVEGEGATMIIRVPVQAAEAPVAS